jgi:hypothetical protein
MQLKPSDLAVAPPLAMSLQIKVAEDISEVGTCVVSTAASIIGPTVTMAAGVNVTRVSIGVAAFP